MKTVLIVDDSPVLRLTIRRHLRDFDVEVLEASQGLEALEILCSRPAVDVVLLDWSMPMLDGMSFLQRLRSNRTIHQPKVIMCSSESDPWKIMEAAQHGADDYVTKPFTSAALIDKLHGTGVL